MSLLSNFIFLSSFIYLLCRILTKEIITENIRLRLEASGHQKLHYLFSCFFCMSISVGCLAAYFFGNIRDAPESIVIANLIYKFLGDSR